MKKEIDSTNEHYLIPAVLAMGLMVGLSGGYFLFEWQQIDSVNLKLPYYNFANLKAAGKYASNCLLSGLSLTTFMLLCPFAILKKSRWASGIYIFLSICLIWLIFSFSF
ncbi:hypothetical protein QWY93_01905 [Echinicola jeungdonensis]|uniref:Uncharacterized protein n=1 Tax=Echinicola jeungdonensis TaxID=709343 RepID=A0ABV5J6V8_9BACT|nr:hypothetical protein [Echinicola jeungdonensis]MDN3668088.1 hypothetical protein [Echinicola jeungdonensis]